MALSRNARRKLARQRKLDKLARMAAASKAADRDKVNAIVKRNLSNPHKPEFTPRGMTQASLWSGAGKPVSSVKHKQAETCTVYGRNVKVTRANVSPHIRGLSEGMMRKMRVDEKK